MGIYNFFMSLLGQNVSRSKRPDAQRMEQIKKFLGNPDNNVLVSFPRTGSHWLRMLMELYFSRPTLEKPFFFKERDDFMLMHVHDIDLEFTCKNLIYLYRNPVDTVYSYISYKKKNHADKEIVAEFANLYGAHLAKWLLKENVSQKKTVVCYENLMSSLGEEFSKITAHFGEEVDIARLEKAAVELDKDKVKEKAADYSKKVVVNTDAAYDDKRRDFANSSGSEIMKIVYECEPKLRLFFEK